MSEYNPFAARLTRAKDHLARSEAKQARNNANDMPGTFVTGNSGVPASRRRKLDAQLDRTIDAASKFVYWYEQVQLLQAKYDAFARGEINYQGRRITPAAAKVPKSSKLPQFARVQDRIFCGEMATGVMWCDKRVKPQDDYKPIVLVFNEDHKESWYKGKFPPELLDEVRKQVAAHLASHVAYKDRSR